MKSHPVEEIILMSDVSNDEAAILLATIERARMTYGSNDDSITDEEMDEDDICDGLVKLLKVYDVAEVISILEDRKYFEIRELLESADPVAKLRETSILYGKE